MTNKLAPYKNPVIMDSIRNWWEQQYPDNRTPRSTHVADLYAQYTTGHDIFDPNYVSPNQFAKCLVAAQVADCGGGYWSRLEGWVPKEYEITRAKAV